MSRPRRLSQTIGALGLLVVAACSSTELTEANDATSPDTAAVLGQETVRSAPSTTASTQPTTGSTQGPSEGWNRDDFDPALEPHVLRALSGEFEGTAVSVAGAWLASAADDMNDLLAQFREETGIEVHYEGMRDYTERLDDLEATRQMPDIIQSFHQGHSSQLAANGTIVPVDDWFLTDQRRSIYDQHLIEATTFDGKFYGAFFKVDPKSLIYYRPSKFAAAGLKVPTSFDELKALSQEIIDRELGSPWCVATQAGDATGWVTTDWLEDVLLRTSPVEVFDQWVNHEIPVDDERVVAALDQVGEIWFEEGAVFGGARGISSIPVGDGADALFMETNERCWLHKQLLWITLLFPASSSDELPNLDGDVDYFVMPGADPSQPAPLLIGGSAFHVVHDRPETRAVLEFLHSAAAIRSTVERGAFFSPNKQVPVEWHPDSFQDIHRLLLTAEVIRLDGTDRMENGLGLQPLFSELARWVEAEGTTSAENLAAVEALWTES